MPTQLTLYNGALRLCGERKLASLAEAREPRRLLDDAYGDGITYGSVKRCLQAGQWTFATRTIQSVASPSVEPDFGYRFAFDQPTDMVRVAAICQDEFFQVPLLQYVDERAYWFADLETIYVKYVSNDADYGADMSLWPESFSDLVEADLANQAVGNLTQSEKRIKFVADALKTAKLNARSLDAMNKPTVMTPPGNWSRARRGSSMRGSRWNGDFQ